VSDPGSLDSVEIFDPRLGTSELAGALAERREAHTAALLSDGSVLVTGGLLDIG
jgi:hypothetical protein